MSSSLQTGASLLDSVATELDSDVDVNPVFSSVALWSFCHKISSKGVLDDFVGNIITGLIVVVDSG